MNTNENNATNPVQEIVTDAVEGVSEVMTDIGNGIGEMMSDAVHGTTHNNGSTLNNNNR